MDAKNLQNEMIAEIFYKIGDKIKAGKCGLSIDELQDIASKFTHIKLYTEDVCKHINCSRSTLYRMIGNGKILKPHKDPGGKEYWYQDELDNYISRTNK
uniref:Helix-turn-helix domain n=1 Tax=Geladintestivirus 1 TaxID=3233133 RepID=A0AAU8MGF4_9CAUD